MGTQTINSAKDCKTIISPPNPKAKGGASFKKKKKKSQNPCVFHLTQELAGSPVGAHLPFHRHVEWKLSKFKTALSLGIQAQSSPVHLLKINEMQSVFSRILSSFSSKCSPAVTCMICIKGQPASEPYFLLKIILLLVSGYKGSIHVH